MQLFSGKFLWHAFLDKKNNACLKVLYRLIVYNLKNQDENHIYNDAFFLYGNC